MATTTRARRRRTTRRGRSSSSCASCATGRSTPGTRAPSRSTTPPGSSSPANASCGCSTRARSSSSTGTSATASPTSGCSSAGRTGTRWSPATGRSRPQGVRLLAGLHRLRREPVRGLRGEDLQGHGPRVEVRLPGDRDQRLGRRTDPGGRRLARRLRGDLLAERPVLRRDPADQPRDGPVRGRRRLLARDHRLRPDGRGNVVHVHHRPRRREDGDRRGGELRGARRRCDAREPIRRGALQLSRRGVSPGRRPLPAQLPAAEQPRPAALHRADRPAPTARTRSSTRSSRTTLPIRTT